ncbi:uncharacterized protein LOC130744154 [Lotus japonicus]|uniref:uncharacterized protein LOC130744154 n=1 Tax=Lotus japonicus TaxID=34305 RepID=UPI00258C142B|nr:uncharacterized protein LOC130744154 [Lotus japonicus]
MSKSKKSKTNVTASSKQTAEDQETQRFEEAQQILNTPNVVTCVKKAEELVVLCGPIYYKLVVEFWKNAVCNDYYVVSHVLDRKIVISEESIAKLLGIEFQQGKRIKNVDANVPGMRKLVNFAIYDNWSMDRTKYAIKDLKPKMKIWQKIFISCIHPRTGGTDYLNATQKVIMYYISRGEPVCLLFLHFNYLKECVEKSRTTGIENKRSISYIPYGRLLSDIFTQNRLVKTLFDLGLHDDLAMSIGDALNGTKLKRMQIIEKVQIEPKEDTSEEDNPACILEYVRMLRREGDPITLEEFVKNLPDSPPEMETRKSERVTCSKPSDPKGKGILIEESKKKKVASKSVGIREPTPESLPKRTSMQSSQLSESESSENSLEDSSSEETEDDDVPLAKRRKVLFEEEDEQDDCEIIENVLQEFSEEATRRLQWLYQVTDNQFDASFVDEDAEMIPAEGAEDSSDRIVILENADVDEVEKQVLIQVDTEIPLEAEVPTPAQAPEVATLAARIDRIQDDQQRLFQMVAQQGLVQSEQSRQIQESSSRMEAMMKYLIENLPSSSKP